MHSEYVCLCHSARIIATVMNSFESGVAMGLFSKLFSKKSTPQAQVIVSQHPRSQNVSAASSKPAKLHPKGKPDSEGLYPGDIAMLNLAETLIVGSERFPDILSSYGVSNPMITLDTMKSKGYVVIGDAIGALPSLKVGELKEIAKTLGVKQSGKKADIITAISNADDGRLNDLVSVRMWCLTDLGRAAVARNSYVGFMMDTHVYNTSLVDFWKMSDICLEHPNMQYRDVFYHQLDEKKNALSMEIVTTTASLAKAKNISADALRKKNSLFFTTEEFCECLRSMALFIEEEGSSYVNAADLYFQYLFERINVHAGLGMANDARLIYGRDKIDKNQLNTYLSDFYRDSQIDETAIKEVLRIKEEAGINDVEFRDALIQSFNRAEHSGFMSPTEAADFVILELSGENQKAEALCRKVGKKALTAMGIKC